jgi:hypothetical protein
VDFQKAREFGESFDPEVESWIVYLEENTGTRGALESALHMALERSREERLPSYTLAAFYFALGQTDKGLELLEHAYAVHEPELAEVAADPMFTSCRSDPRFAAFLRRIGLTR